MADGWHLRTDVYTSAGVMLGLGVIEVGRRFFGLHLDWLDPVVAISVALLILHAAYELTVQSIRDLLDARLPDNEEAWIRDYVGRLNPTIRGFHRLRTRKSGPTRFIQFHVIVEAGMSVEDAHRISEVITCDIEDRFPHCSVIAHIEPCTGECDQVCTDGCLLSEEERTAVRAGKI
jgi:cation diffusion facilitator family transporter